MTDRVFAIEGEWALASDGLQWMLMRHRKGRDPWRAVSFVSSSKDVLARCMREKGVEPGIASSCSPRYQRASSTGNAL